jgi:signal transduction histidine kinase
MTADRAQRPAGRPGAPPPDPDPVAVDPPARWPGVLRWLVVAGLAFTALDLSIGLAGERTTGALGPWAGLALQLVVSLSLPLLVVAPRVVVGLVVLVAVLMAGSDAFAPGLLVPESQLTPATVPRATPIVIIWLVLAEPARVSYPVVAVLGVLAGRLWAPSWSDSPFGLLSTVLPAVVALYLDARARLVRSLRDRAERAEREQHLLADKVRADERRRLAMEMHDVVTHRLSAMVLHASALGVSSREPAVLRAAEDLRAAGTTALQELRDLIGVLREGAGEIPTSTPGGARAGDVSELVLGSEVGVGPVELDLQGSADQVSTTVARTAYRIVQEAMTNVRKHAPGAEVGVHVHYSPDRVRVRVRNGAGALPADPVLAGSGSGRGLEGLARRVELIGGRLDAGPTTGGGFAVDAVLPAYVPTTRAEPRRADSGVLPGDRGVP